MSTLKVVKQMTFSFRGRQKSIRRVGEICTLRYRFSYGHLAAAAMASTILLWPTLAEPAAATAPLTGTASCIAEGAGQFDCNAHGSGGTAPYWEVWSGVGVTFTNGSGDFAWGTCKPNEWYTVSAKITDAMHAQFIAQARFKCEGGPLH
jgi:hypothetical protein